MTFESEIRTGEATTVLPSSVDAGIFFLGRIHTPWRERRDCPRRGDFENGPVCRVEVDPRWHGAFSQIHQHERLELLYWMHLARRDLVLQNPKQRGRIFGTFALRSPMRPNPISSSIVALVSTEPGALLVRGLDCIDGTPLVDIKPVHCPMWPASPHGVADHR